MIDIIYLKIDDRRDPKRYASSMLNYARQRIREVLAIPDKAVLITSGPAGIQAGEFPCEAVDLQLFLLVPEISDHLFNLEHVSAVTLLSPAWEVKGEAKVVSRDTVDFHPELLEEPEAGWCILVRVEPYQVQIRGEKGWGIMETYDLS